MKSILNIALALTLLAPVCAQAASQSSTGNTSAFVRTALDQRDKVTAAGNALEAPGFARRALDTAVGYGTGTTGKVALGVVLAYGAYRLGKKLYDNRVATAKFNQDVDAAVKSIQENKKKRAPRETVSAVVTTAPSAKTEAVATTPVVGTSIGSQVKAAVTSTAAKVVAGGVAAVAGAYKAAPSVIAQVRRADWNSNFAGSRAYDYTKDLVSSAASKVASMVANNAKTTVFGLALIGAAGLAFKYGKKATQDAQPKPEQPESAVVQAPTNVATTN